MMNIKQATTLTLLILFGCGKTETVDTAAVKEAIEQREIKKISDIDIIDKASGLGKKDEQVFINCLNKGDGSINSEAIRCVKNSDTARIINLKIVFNSDVSKLDELEKSLVEAYNFNFTKNQPLYSNVQDLKSNVLLYSFPVYKKDKKFSLSKSDLPVEFGIVMIYMSKQEVIRRI